MIVSPVVRFVPDHFDLPARKPPVVWPWVVFWIIALALNFGSLIGLGYMVWRLL